MPISSLDTRLVVEVDDPAHELRDETVRTGFFESLCFTVHRFTNKQIAQELPEVVGTITDWVEHIQEHGTAPE